jgi:uncharacterized protein
MKAKYILSANNVDITDTIKDHFMNFSLSDLRSLEADKLTITLDDSKGIIEMPRRGVELRLWLGYEGEELVDKGTYIVDASSLSGPPDIMTIQSSSANFHTDLKIEKDLSYDFVNLGWLIEEIAKRNALKPAIEEGLKQITIEQLDQTGESDANLITRLAKEYDAIATVKSGYLVFVPVGYTKTISGISLPTLHIDRKDGDRYTYDVGDRDSRYTGVKAKWHDLKAGKTKIVEIGEEGYMRKLKETFPTEAEARANAQTEWNRMQRGKTTMTISLAKGRMDLAPNHPITLAGWRREISTTEWISGEITHSLNDSGLTTEVKLEEAIYEGLS